LLQFKFSDSVGFPSGEGLPPINQGYGLTNRETNVILTAIPRYTIHMYVHGAV